MVTAKKTVLAFVCVFAIALLFYLDLQRFLTLAELKTNQKALMNYYAAHRLIVVAGFLLVYIAQTAFSLPGAAIMSLAAGALFGTFLGTVYANIAATLGATLAFLITRYLLRDAVTNAFGKKLEGLNRELEIRGFKYLLFLRLVPVFPFFLINLAAGLTRVPLQTFIIGTMIGIIPGSFIYVNAGASLAAVESLSGIASPRVIVSFTLLGLFAIIPLLYNKFRNRNQ